jgi:hypothetical protein
MSKRGLPAGRKAATRRALAGVCALSVGVLGWLNAIPGTHESVASATVASATAGNDDKTAPERAKASGERVELLGKRTDFEQTFANPDGTYTLEQSNVPVRTEKDGQWVDLDPTLSTSPDGRVRPKATSLDMSFSGGGTDPLISIKSDGHELKLKWPGSLPEPVVADDNVTYPNVYPDVDLKITASGSTYSEVLVVKTPEAARLPQLQSLDLGMEAPGLNVAEVAGGAVLAKDSLGKVIFTGPPPAMWDSRGGAKPPAGGDRTEAPLEGDKVVQIPVEVDNDSLKLSPGTSLSNDAAAKYPLHIDPGFGAQEGRAMIDGAHPTSSYWNWTGTEGVGYQDYSPPTRKRLLFKFNINGLGGTHVLSAQFSAFETWSASCNKREVQVWKTAAIGTSINWNNGSGSNIWLKELDSVVDAAGWDTACSPNGKLLEFNVLTAAAEQAAARNTWLNLGLRASETDTLAWKRFRTDAKISITYNHLPAVADPSMTEPTAGCATDYQNPSRINQQSPIPHIKIRDLDSAPVQAGFEIWHNGGQEPDQRRTSVTKATSYTTDFTPQTNVTALRENFLLGWRARAWDGHDYSAWSDMCWFTIDTQAPKAPDVTITSGADVVYSLGQMIDVKISGGDGSPNYYRYSIDSDEPTSTNLQVSPGTFSFKATRTGPTMIRAWSYDRSSNQSAEYGKAVVTIQTGPAAGIWHMDEGIGTSLADTSGLNRPITLSGPTSWDHGDKWNPADAHGDWSVVMPPTASATSAATNIVDTSHSFSASVRVKLSNVAGRQVALSENRTGTSGFTLGVLSQDLSDPEEPKATWAFTMPNPNGSNELLVKSVPTSYQAGVWVYLTGVYDSWDHTLTLYINRDAFYTTSSLPPTTDSVGALRIGTGIAANVAYPINGQVDDVRIYPGPIDNDAVAFDMDDSSPTN